MKNPPTFVIIMAGVVPPGDDLAILTNSIKAAVTLSIPLSECMRGTLVALTEENAVDLLKRLGGEVEPIPAPRPGLVQ